MRLLKNGMRDPLVLVLRQWLKEAGYDDNGVCYEIDVFDGPLKERVELYQTARKLDVDGIVGTVQTWPALERDHLAYQMAHAPKVDVASLPPRPPSALALQDVLNIWASGKVGYGTPQDSRVKMMKRPVSKRSQADRYKGLELPGGKEHGTTHTCGGCSSFASRTLMRIVRDPEGRPHTNQTGPTPPQSMRDPRFVNVRDNVPDAMIEGDRTWQSGDWRPTCRGYAHLFDHRASLEWIELHEAMRGVPFAILHLQGGHVICAFWSDHNSGLWYTHPVTGELLMDDECYILAADGWSGNVGQPTTLQTDDSRLSKKHIDHLWMCMRPDGYATPSAELACCLAP